jgi:hypothetical protein
MLNDIFEYSDILFNMQRDKPGNGYGIAFVIDGTVVHVNAFNIELSKKIFLDGCSYSSNIEDINGTTHEVITASNGFYNIKFIVDDFLTSILLSNPQIVKLRIPEDRKVSSGWLYDGNIFHTNRIIGGIERVINGEGDVINVAT